MRADFIGYRYFAALLFKPDNMDDRYTTHLKVWLPLLALLCSLATAAQDSPGASASGMGGAYLVMSDVWSGFHNQAGLAHLEGISAGVNYENRFSLNQLSDKGVIVAAPFGIHAAGISYRSFGYELFSSSKTSLAYAIKLSDKFSAGMQFNMHNIRLGENYGSQTALSVEGGFLYKMNEKVSVAAHIYNPTRAKLSEFNDERIPSMIRIGAGYRFSKKVILTAEVRKPSDADASVRAGLEYYVVDAFALRMGFASDPSQYAFGFGWKLKTFRLDVATGYHQVLGFTPQISLTYMMDKK
jgi:hypothetical protein